MPRFGPLIHGDLPLVQELFTSGGLLCNVRSEAGKRGGFGRKSVFGCPEAFRDKEEQRVSRENKGREERRHGNQNHRTAKSPAAGEALAARRGAAQGTAGPKAEKRSIKESTIQTYSEILYSCSFLPHLRSLFRFVYYTIFREDNQ